MAELESSRSCWYPQQDVPCARYHVQHQGSLLSQEGAGRHEARLPRSPGKLSRSAAQTRIYGFSYLDNISPAQGYTLLHK